MTLYKPSEDAEAPKIDCKPPATQNGRSPPIYENFPRREQRWSHESFRGVPRGRDYSEVLREIRSRRSLAEHSFDSSFESASGYRDDFGFANRYVQHLLSIVLVSNQHYSLLVKDKNPDFVKVLE